MKNNSKGCVVAVIIGGLLLGGFALIVVLFLVKRGQRVERSELHEAVRIERGQLGHLFDGADEGALVLERAELRALAVPGEGEEITRESFAAFALGDDATDLAKAAFRSRAEGATVSWLLRTANVADEDGVLRGEFELPWQISDGSRTTSSSISVRAEFTEASRAGLLKLRRGDWVTVKGELSFGGSPVVMKDARLEP